MWEPRWLDERDWQVLEREIETSSSRSFLLSSKVIDWTSKREEGDFGRGGIENPLFIRFDYAKRSKINEASSADPSNLYAAIDSSPAFWNQRAHWLRKWERSNRNPQIENRGVSSCRNGASCCSKQEIKGDWSRSLTLCTESGLLRYISPEISRVITRERSLRFATRHVARLRATSVSLRKGFRDERIFRTFQGHSSVKKLNLFGSYSTMNCNCRPLKHSSSQLPSLLAPPNFTFFTQSTF